MSKIKVGELREVLKELNSKQIGVETIDFHGTAIEVKQFLPIQDKFNLVASIFESAIDREDGLHILDKNKLEIAFKNLIVTEYSNLTLPKNTIESYDMLCESGLFNSVYNGIPEGEREELQTLLDGYIDTEKQEYQQRNTIQYVLKNSLDRLIDKMPSDVELGELIESASKEFSNFDPNKLTFLKDAIGWNGGVEK